jgi:hypothetical protein
MKDSACYTNGAAARAQGYPLSANPNCIGSAAFYRWAAQWHEENNRLAADSAARHRPIIGPRWNDTLRAPAERNRFGRRP